MTLHLVRHAMPEASERVAPDSWVLSQAGRRAARLLRGELPAGAVLLASTETKAIETVALAAGVASSLVRQDPDFSEVARPGEPFDDHHRDRRLAWICGALDACHQGWETWSGAAYRFQRGLDRVAGCDKMVVGTHGMVMTAWLVETGRLPCEAAGDFWAGLLFPAVHVVS